MTSQVPTLESVETALRIIIRTILGNDWSDTLSVDKQAALTTRQQQDARTRPSISSPTDLILFTDLSDLINIILKHWEQFSTVFGNKKRTEVFFDILMNGRNPTAHSRHLANHELELMSGASTYLRNQIALHRSQQEPSSEFYPLIESCIDSFGRTGSQSHSSAPGSNPRVNVGDIITFKCSAIDPRGRDLTWGVYASLALLDDAEDVFTVTGSEVNMSYIINEADVGESFSLSILMRSNGRFRRTGGTVYTRDATMEYVRYDDERIFSYAVNPPID